MTLNATIPGQERINPKIHLCRTFLLSICKANALKSKRVGRRNFFLLLIIYEKKKNQGRKGQRHFLFRFFIKIKVNFTDKWSYMVILKH